jgi:cytochrome c oxidase subunit 1
MSSHAPAHAAHGHEQHAPSVPLSYWWKRVAWMTPAFFGAGLVLVWLVRAVFGMEPLWNAEAYYTVAILFAGMGFLTGIGCFDWWLKYAIGGKVDFHDHSFHGATSWKAYFRVNTDHKVIGTQYVVLTFIFFLFGGLFAEAIRAELAEPGQQFVNGEQYNGLFSTHAVIMIFLFIIPMYAGLANYVLPIMIGAKDMAFPKLNALSFWMLVPAGAMILASPFVGYFSAGWTQYAPLAIQGGTGVTLFQVGVQFAGFSSIFTAINFLATIATMRAPGMTVWRMPLLVWANATTSALVVFGTPFVAGSQFMNLFDRVMGTNFFDATQGGDVIAYQHIFWFYSHPAVYIMMIPGFGIISEVLATFSRKPVFGYRALAMATVAIAVLGFGVWAHHMFTSGMADWLRIPMMITTIIIAVPTGIKVFSWLGTIWRGKLHMKTPMLYALGFLFTFTIGGLSGVFLGTVPITIAVTDTYFIVAHIHYVFVGGSAFTIFAGIYYWFPKMTGRMYNERLGQWQFWLFFIGFNATMYPMHWLGLQGMPRRVADYDERFAELNLLISIASILMVISTLLFVYNMVHSWARGPKAPWNPWRGRSLEWLVSSPPSIFNFETDPLVVGGPYQYGIEGARHAVVYAPAEIGGELTEAEKRTILVIAHETLASQQLVDAIRRKAGEEYFWRFTIAVPAAGRDKRAADRRLQTALAVLAQDGIDASGQVYDLGPVEAAAKVAGEEKVHGTIVATYSKDSSRWLQEDVVDRIRKSLRMDLTQIVVTPGDVIEAYDATGVEHVVVIGRDGLSSSGLVAELERRADVSPLRVTVLAAAGIEGPAWTDEANALREDIGERAGETLGLLLLAGIPAQGEVIDRDAATAAEVAVDSYAPDLILVASARGETAIESSVEAVRERAGVIEVEHVIVDAEAPAAPMGF